MTPLSLDQTVQLTNELVRCWSNTFRPPTERRNALLFGLMLHGLRMTEATTLRRNQLNADANLIRFAALKGGTTRTLRVSQNWTTAAVQVHREMELRAKRPLKLLLGTAKDKSVNHANVNESIGKLTTKLFAVQISTHTLRHTAAMICWHQSHDPVTVQKFLGHRHLRTTEIYLRSIEPQPTVNAIDFALEIRPPLQLFNPERHPA